MEIKITNEKLKREVDCRLIQILYRNGKEKMLPIERMECFKLFNIIRYRFQNNTQNLPFNFKFRSGFIVDLDTHNIKSINPAFRIKTNNNSHLLFYKNCYKNNKEEIKTMAEEYKKELNYTFIQFMFKNGEIVEIKNLKPFEYFNFRKAMRAGVHLYSFFDNKGELKYSIGKNAFNAFRGGLDLNY